MKKLLVLGGFMLLIAGCGNTVPMDGPSDLSEDPFDQNPSAEGRQLVSDTMTDYRFNFPNSGWYIDFIYPDGYTVEPQKGQIVFTVDSGKEIIFDYDNGEEEIGGGAEFIGNGWWGMYRTGHVVFNTPDKKYYIDVRSDDQELLESFSHGMTLGK